MQIQRHSDGQILTLEDRFLLGSGGEARIYTLPEDPALVAKIWHKPTPERTRKVQVMLANPPMDPMASLSHSSIAWPLDLLVSRDARHRPVGFLMKRVTDMRPIIDFFNPKSRLQKCPLFSYYYLHRTARNLATVLRALHERGYVVGDLNESNVLVSEKALVTLVDTDSFQVWDAQAGLMYRCRVGKPEFTAPELQGQPFGQIDRDPAHDQFGLAVLLFQLLLEGTHPFAGAYLGRGEPPLIEQRIAAGSFPYDTDPRIPFRPKPAAPPLGILHPTLVHYFLRCFRDGHREPSARPEAAMWQRALDEAEQSLVTCPENPQHVFGNHLRFCPWCERTRMLGGRDPFPSVDAVKAGKHRRRAKPARTSGFAPPRREPPVPRPIPVPAIGTAGWPTPPVSPLTRLLRQQWPWIGFGLACASLTGLGLTMLWYLRLSLVAYLFGFAAAVLGLAQEAVIRRTEPQAHWLSRAAMVSGVIIVIATVFTVK